MSKGSRIMSVRFPGKLLEMVESACSGAKNGIDIRTPGFGEWVREACRQRLDHLARSRKKPADKPVKCDECKCTVKLSAIACEWVDLFGRKRYRCQKCESTNFTK